MTAEKYYAATIEGDRTQLVDGVVVVNEPRFIHGVLQARLAHSLQSWIATGEGRGVVGMPTDVRMDEHNVYGPDLVWFSERSLPAAFPSGLDAYPERVPDLCVEIRSTSTWRHDIGAKKRVYEAGGLPELWLVDDASETMLVYRRSARGLPTFDVALELGCGESLASPQLPGFSLALDELFER